MSINFNPINILLNFTFLLLILFLNTFYFLNEKFTLMLIIIFLVGGIMIFISIISSTIKFNYHNRKKFFISFSILFIIPLFSFPLTNMFSLVRLNLWNNFIVFFIILIIIIFIFLLKFLLVKKQKRLKV